MNDLLALVQKECSAAVWSRAVQLARTGSISGKRTHNDEIELRVITKGGMVSPLVVLAPKQRDWSCECASDEPVCIHVATAAIAILDAQKEGKEAPGIKAAAATVVYRLSRSDGHLALERFISRDNQLKPLSARLTTTKRQDFTDDLAVSQANIAVDMTMGSLKAGKIPIPIMDKLLAALAECKDVQLDGKPVAIGEPAPVIAARVEDHVDGFLLIADQNKEISEVFANGAVLYGGVLRPIGQIDLSDRDLDDLRKGQLLLSAR